MLVDILSNILNWIFITGYVAIILKGLRTIKK